MEAKDPLEQAADALRKAQLSVQADAARLDAEMVILSTVSGYNEVQADILSRGLNRGPQYTAALVVAVCLSARMWARAVSGKPINFGDYMEDPDTTEEWDVRAHDTVKRFLNVSSPLEGKPVGQEVEAFLNMADQETVGMYVTHVVALAADLVDSILRIKRDVVREQMTREQPEG